MKTFVMIVDDHQIVRDGLKAILHQEEGIGVIAEADNCRSALRLVEELKPEIVIMAPTLRQAEKRWPESALRLSFPYQRPLVMPGAAPVFTGR